MKKIVNGAKNAFFYVKDFCEDTADNIKETAMTVMDSTKLQYRVISQRNELNAMYATLGRALYSSVSRNGEGPQEVTEDIGELCERINAKDEILKGLEKQLRIVAGKVICSGCGRFMSDRYAYCPYCGKRVSDEEPYDEFFVSDITGDELDEVRQLDDI